MLRNKPQARENVNRILRSDIVDTLVPELLASLITLCGPVTSASGTIAQFDWPDAFLPLLDALDGLVRAADLSETSDDHQEEEDKDDLGWAGSGPGSISGGAAGRIYHRTDEDDDKIDDKTWIHRNDVENHNLDGGHWICIRGVVCDLQTLVSSTYLAAEGNDVYVYLYYY